MKKTYISGQITGIEAEAPLIFAEAEKKLKKLGFDTINPITINHDHHDKSWTNYMREDIKAMCDCSKIFMLSNWVQSKGAIVENTLAYYLDLQMMHEQGFDNWWKKNYLGSYYPTSPYYRFLRHEIKELCDATILRLPFNYQSNHSFATKHYVALVLGIEIIYT